MKSRKLSSLVAGLMVIASVNATVQPSSKPACGIYKTASDFAQEKITHPIAVQDKKHHLVLHTMFQSSKIDVVDEGVKTSFKRSEIFGYRDNGADYRVVGDKDLAIVDASSFVLYSNTVEVAGMKGHMTKEVVYYFSVDANSDIKQLTKENLKEAFATNNRFRYYLDAFFKSDRDLIAFDPELKKYKVKYIYETSLKDNEGSQAKNIYKPLL